MTIMNQVVGDGAAKPVPTTIEEKLCSGEAYRYFEVNDLVPIYMEGYGNVQFDVVAKGHDGTNVITLVSRNIIYEIDFGDKSNYDGSKLRLELNNTILSKFSPEIQNAIVPVAKKSANTTINDKLWMLSANEMNVQNDGSTYWGSEGNPYSFFSNESQRKKLYKSKYSDYWLRTREDSDFQCTINADGTRGYGGMNATFVTKGIVFGLCF